LRSGRLIGQVSFSTTGKQSWAGSAAGTPFAYEDGGAQRRLLQYPLDPGAISLDPEHRQFTAARSMRDVEYASYLRVLDPRGNPIQGASDAQ
jgi:hypothetical protein